MPNEKSKANRSHPPALRTAAQVKADFEARGITAASFARDHDLPPGVVYQVLSGEKKGRRGDAHRAAVLLGMKAGIA